MGGGEEDSSSNEYKSPTVSSNGESKEQHGRTHPRSHVLFIDEVDVFLNEDFYGNFDHPIGNKISHLSAAHTSRCRSRGKFIFLGKLKKERKPRNEKEKRTKRERKKEWSSRSNKWRTSNTESESKQPQELWSWR
jgi:hypothetical protein